MSDPQEQQHVSSKMYLFVFFLLCGCTVASWLVDELVNGTMLLIVSVLAIATLKAGCVILYFMHLKFERNWKYVLLLPTTILAIGLPLALLPDMGFPYYTNVTPQSSYTPSAHESTSQHDAGTDSAKTTEQQ